MAVLSEQILAAAALRLEGSLLAAKQFLALWVNGMRWTRPCGAWRREASS